MCNWKMIRYDYPNLHRWLRRLYYEVDEESKGAFQSTTHFKLVGPAPESRRIIQTHFAQFMEGYAISAKRMDLVPWGPAVPIMPLDA